MAAGCSVCPGRGSVVDTVHVAISQPLLNTFASAVWRLSIVPEYRVSIHITRNETESRCRNVIRVDDFFATVPSGGHVHVGEGNPLLIEPYSKRNGLYTPYCLFAVLGYVQRNVMFDQAQ